MRRSLLAVVTTAATATTALLLTGCGDDVERVAGMAAPATAPSTAPATTAATAATASTASTVAPPTATTAEPEPTATTAPATRRPSKTPDTACPVSDGVLQKAVGPDQGSGITQSSPLTKIVCYRNYAAATVPERSNSDEQFIVFKYASGSWSVHSSGSGDICPGVPADVIKRFRSARYGACS